MHTDHEACARAVRSRDARFDGWFYTGVVSTGIYCRPSCPAMTPAPRQMRFFPSAAAAQGAGFRACKRCRPDASPGSPEWHYRGDVVARAMRLIAAGVVDTDGVSGLAARLGYSARQVERLVTAELGAGPLALAKAQRARTARTLIETTTLPMADIAFAAGFSSIRSFNETIRAVFAETPSRLRRAVGPVPSGPGAQTLHLRLAHRRPLHAVSLFGHLAATAVAGMEQWRDGGLERSLRLPHGVGTVHLRPAPTHMAATVQLTDLRDLTPAIQQCRRLLDLDADPVAVDAQLGVDPHLGPLVERASGARLPGTVDPHELAMRVVLGQQVSTAGAATTTARLVASLGEALPVELTGTGLTHTFPAPGRVAAATTAELPGMPAARRETLRRLAAALADGTLRLGDDVAWARAREQLHALRGLGPWSVEMIALRGLGDPDAFPATDLGLRAAAASVGLPQGAAALLHAAEAWRPWRSYATQILWSSLDHAVNRMPEPLPTQESA